LQHRDFSSDLTAARRPVPLLEDLSRWAADVRLDDVRDRVVATATSQGLSQLTAARTRSPVGAWSSAAQSAAAHHGQRRLPPG